jgi:DNA polymerase-3 subunit epsilon
LTGINLQMVAGQRIDADTVPAFVADAVLVIAHGAAFDRPFCEALLPVFVDKHWACFNTQNRLASPPPPRQQAHLPAQ